MSVRLRSAALAANAMVIQMFSQYPTPTIALVEPSHENRRAMKPKASKKKRGKGR